MKKNILFALLAGFLLSTNSHAWFSINLDDVEWSDRSGRYYGPGYGPGPHYSSRNINIVKGHDPANYYLYIELQGMKPEEIDIQRQGPRISISQVHGRGEQTEYDNYYRSYESYSSFTRRLTLPPDAERDMSKMKREHKDGNIRLTIPRVPQQQPWGY